MYPDVSISNQLHQFKIRNLQGKKSWIKFLKTEAAPRSGRAARLNWDNPRQPPCCLKCRRQETLDAPRLSGGRQRSPDPSFLLARRARVRQGGRLGHPKCQRRRRIPRFDRANPTSRPQIVTAGLIDGSTWKWRNFQSKDTRRLTN